MGLQPILDLSDVGSSDISFCSSQINYTTRLSRENKQINIFNVTSVFNQYKKQQSKYKSQIVYNINSFQTFKYGI
jgi:hypothetical protein